MKGGDCEEAKSVQRRTGASQQGSEHLRVKRKRVMKDKEIFSRCPRRTSASQGGSERDQVKRKKAKREHVCWEPSRTDAVKGGFEHLLPKPKGIKEDGVCREQRETDAAPRQIDGSFPRGGGIKMHKINEEGNLRNAKIALEFYEKSEGVEFEILEVLFSRGSRLRLPGSEDSQYWLHTSFVAKPRNGDCSDVSPKHFFGELLNVDRSGKFSATYCSTFEPSDEPGFNHGCIFCAPDQKFHPVNRYYVGRPPWYIPRRVYGFPMGAF